MRGRNVHSIPKLILSIPTQQVLLALKSIHKNIRLFIDIFFVNSILFLHSISQHIGLRTAEVLPDRYADSLLEHL